MNYKLLLLIQFISCQDQGPIIDLLPCGTGGSQTQSFPDKSTSTIKCDGKNCELTFCDSKKNCTTDNASQCDFQSTKSSGTRTRTATSVVSKTTSVETSTPTITLDTQQQESKGLSGAAIAGIVILSFLVIFGLATLVYSKIIKNKDSNDTIAMAPKPVTKDRPVSQSITPATSTVIAPSTSQPEKVSVPLFPPEPKPEKVSVPLFAPENEQQYAAAYQPSQVVYNQPMYHPGNQYVAQPYHAAGYPAANGAYPPEGSNYAATNGAYPPQDNSQAYPPNGGAYPPQDNSQGYYTPNQQYDIYQQQMFAAQANQQQMMYVYPPQMQQGMNPAYTSPIQQQPTQGYSQQPSSPVGAQGNSQQ